MVSHNTTKTVLVTGATAGIGRHVALDLAGRGHRVFATGRNPQALASLSGEAAARDLPLTTVVLDVTSEDSIASALATVRGATGGYGVDVLINNAGYGQGGPLLEVDDATLRSQFDTNVFGLMAVTRAFVKDMLGRGRGWVVNVSSVGGRVTFPLFGAYHASKYALEALSDALRCELQPFGVHVALVEPGPIHSQFSERAFGSLPSGQDASLYAASYSLATSIRTASDSSLLRPRPRRQRGAQGDRFAVAAGALRRALVSRDSALLLALRAHAAARRDLPARLRTRGARLARAHPGAVGMKPTLLAVALASVTSLVAIGPVAHADNPSDAGLRDYYGGERLSAYVIGGTAAAAAASGGYLVTRDGAFPRSLGWSWIALGGLELTGAIAYAFQVGSEIDHYEAALAHDPAAYRSEEADHMRGTASRFVVYRASQSSISLRLWV